MMPLSHIISEILGPQLCKVHLSGINMEHIIWLTYSVDLIFSILTPKTRYVSTCD